MAYTILYVLHPQVCVTYTSLHNFVSLLCLRMHKEHYFPCQENRSEHHRSSGWRAFLCVLRTWICKTGAGPRKQSYSCGPEHPKAPPAARGRWPREGAHWPLKQDQQPRRRRRRQRLARVWPQSPESSVPYTFHSCSAGH